MTEQEREEIKTAMDELFGDFDIRCHFRLNGPPTTRVSREEIAAEYARACREVVSAVGTSIWEDGNDDPK